MGIGCLALCKVLDSLIRTKMNEAITSLFGTKDQGRESFVLQLCTEFHNVDQTDHNSVCLGLNLSKPNLSELNLS